MGLARVQGRRKTPGAKHGVTVTLLYRGRPAALHHFSTRASHRGASGRVRGKASSGPTWRGRPDGGEVERGGCSCAASNAGRCWLGQESRLQISFFKLQPRPAGERAASRPANERRPVHLCPTPAGDRPLRIECASRLCHASCSGDRVVAPSRWRPAGEKPEGSLSRSSPSPTGAASCFVSSPQVWPWPGSSTPPGRDVKQPGSGASAAGAEGLFPCPAAPDPNFNPLSS